MVLCKSWGVSSATRDPEQGHVGFIELVATEPHFLHLMSCSWYRTLRNTVSPRPPRKCNRKKVVCFW